MKVTIQITATAVVVTQYNADGSVASSQSYAPTLNAGGSFGWSCVFPNPQLSGSPCSCMVFMNPDGGARATNLSA